MPERLVISQNSLDYGASMMKEEETTVKEERKKERTRRLGRRVDSEPQSAGEPPLFASWTLVSARELFSALRRC